MATDRAPDIYVPLLMTKGHGYPLWLPDPFSTLPPAYLRCGTQVGDLGYLTDDGGFAYLFNVCKDASDPINLNRVPPDFVPVMGIPDPGIQGRLEMHDKNSVITTAAVEQKSIGFAVSAGVPNVPVVLGAGCGFEFTSSSSQAAVLVLPDGGERYESEHPLLLQEYAISNAHSWYKYLNGPGQGRQIRNGMLYLVTGYDKCHSWGNTCYSHPSGSSSASLKFIATDVIVLTGTVHYSWEVQSGVHKRNHHRDMTPGATANQTIFLRGYSISVREDSSLLVKLGLKNPVETFKIDERKSKAPWFRSSVPYSAAPQSSTTPAATETGTSRTTQGDSAGMERGASLFNFDDLEIERSLYDEYSGSEVSESSEDESETDTSVMDIPYGHTTMQADTLVQHLPGRGKIINPSGLINHHILDIHPGATIALTHDDFEWTDMENDVRNPLNVMELVKYAIDNNLVSIDKSLTTPNAWVAKRRDTVIQRFSRQKDIFALVIGIDKYQCKEYTDLQGACSDADNFEAYLVESLRTPKANIISLRDGKATRSAIIDKLIRMKDNANIQQDMAAIIIYFAGYGATTNNPAGRSIDDTSDMKIEMLCMTDIGILDKSNKVVNGIPAKTINQLLLELSLVRGNNITLILDCSYAAIPSDAQKRADAPPDANPRQIFDPPKLSWGCDQDIYSRRVIYPRDQDIYSILTDPFIYLRQDIHSFGGHSFGSSLLDSYVLLAACSRHQLAYESQGEGLFTRELLKVLKEWPINKLSYKSLTDRLDMPAYQTPLLEGGHMNRCLFDSGGRTTDSSRILCHREKDQPYFTLYAGSNCRIISGSTFEIYRTDLTDDWRPFTTATVETVEAFISFLKPADQTIFTIHENHHVWYARFVTSPAPGFTIYCNNSNFLAQILDEGVGPWLVDPPSSVSNPLLADLCLTVDGSDVFYDLGDRNTRSLCSRSMNFSPRFPHTSSVHAIAEIRIIIDSYAHFTSRIMMPSPLPMAKLVTVEMKKVRPSGPFIQGFQKVYKPYSENLLPDAADKFVELGPFSDMQALIYYGFTVHNTSDDRLYVSLLAFKLSNLEIAHLFSSTTYLEPHSTHTFCDGDIDGLSYMFVIPEGLDENVIFLKFFVADEPINFDNLSQQPPLAEGRPIVREAWHPSTFGKRWASMTIPIINRRETLGNPEARDQGKME